MRFICQSPKDEEDHLLINLIKAQQKTYVIVPLKKLMRCQFVLTCDDIPIGDIDFVKHFYAYFGIKLINDDYPQFCFASTEMDYLKRKIFQSTLRKVIENDQQIFIKPATDVKKFTGFVYSNDSDIYKTNNSSLNTKVWCSQVVNFVAEYRCFVLKKELIGYVECPNTKLKNLAEKLDINLVKEFVKTYHRTSYVVDFGVLESGETALIEVNLGTSFGIYGFDAEKCFEIIIDYCKSQFSSNIYNLLLSLFKRFKNN